MSSGDASILKDFQDESKTLLEKMILILEQCEGDFRQVQGLEEYGLTVDRIMGGAKTLNVALEKPSPIIDQIGDYAAICKAVGYKASQIVDNEQFYDICVAFLQDATEVLEELIAHLFDGGLQGEKFSFSKAFIDRLKWVSNQFGEGFRSSVDVHKGQPAKMNQHDIDELMKKLGLD